jgi:hypothetical protein
MLSQINVIGPRLNLPMTFPVAVENLRRTFVIPPVAHDDIMGGRIDAENWSFGFTARGRLRFVENMAVLRAWNRMHYDERDKILLRQSPVIDTNDAYVMATNWLDGMYVNVAGLEKESPIEVERDFRWKDHIRNGTKEFLPLFWVTWGHRGGHFGVKDLSRLKLQIDGSTKQLVELRLDDPLCPQQIEVLIKNRDELSKIPDEEFLKYSEQQRRELVARFGAVVFGTQNNGTNGEAAGKVPAVGVPSTSSTQEENFNNTTNANRLKGAP